MFFVGRVFFEKVSEVDHKSTEKSLKSIVGGIHISSKINPKSPKKSTKKWGTPSDRGDQNRGTPSAQVVVVLGTFLAAS